MNDNEKYIEEFLKDIPFDAPNSRHRDELKMQLLSAFPKHRLQPTVHTVHVWRIIMNKPLVKLAVAAVIIVAVLIGLNILPISGGVALAEVLDKVRDIKTVFYKTKADIKGLPGTPADQITHITTEVKLSYDKGVRINSQIQLPQRTVKTDTYILFDKRVLYTLMPADKKYIEMTLTDELMEKMDSEGGDPVTLLKAMAGCEHVDLGHDTINGIEVWGIEATDPVLGTKLGSALSSGMFDSIVVRLWVDVKTKLPVRLTAQGSSKNGEISMDCVIDEFQWDVEIDPAELEPAIPEDYELLGQATWDVGNEGEDIVEVLEFFAEYTDGKYPSSLSTMTVAQEIVGPLRQKLAPYQSSGGLPKEVLDKLMKLDRVGQMYAALENESKDPAYYGNKVTAEFPHAVLLRWKIGDDRYRVVFGDLSIRNVTSDELGRLEAAPLNPQSKAIKPQPADGLIGTQIEGLELSWMPRAHATGHIVYIGTGSDALKLLTEVSDSTPTVTPDLERGVTYYWRVDEVQSDGSIVAGDVWSFSPGGLVGWWKLDEGSGGTVADSSGNNLHGTIAGNPAWIDGATGKALQFDGDGDYVDLGNDSSLNLTAQITVAAWIKVNTFDCEWQAIITKGDGSWRLQRNGTQGSIEFACTGAFVPGALVGSLFGTVSVNDGQWHHITGTYDGSMICLYVDGEHDIASDAAGSIEVNDSNLFIGANAEKPNRNFNGSIDDVRIYSYALSAEEVQAISADRNPGPEK
ncbi:MAG: LamG domain-containing protein [Sedimentisphaerales bacterium]